MNDDQLIDALGGTKKVSEICDVSKSAVSQWRRNGMPRAQRRYLELLRPDVFAAAVAAPAPAGQAEERAA